MDKVAQFWNEYLVAHDLPKTTPCAGEISFGCNKEMSDALTALVLAGVKQATTSALEAFQIDNEKLPAVGNVYVITNFEGEPLGILKTTAVTLLPYKDVTWSMAQKEGEDENMESWLCNHDSFFEEDGDIMGYDFTPDMTVVFEEFTLL